MKVISNPKPWNYLLLFYKRRWKIMFLSHQNTKQKTHNSFDEGHIQAQTKEKIFIAYLNDVLLLFFCLKLSLWLFKPNNALNILNNTKPLNIVRNELKLKVYIYTYNGLLLYKNFFNSTKYFGCLWSKIFHYEI